MICCFLISLFSIIRCAVISVAAPGSTKTYVCNGMEGRYINIVVPGKHQQLILCEVEVTGQLSENTATTGDLNHDLYIGNQPCQKLYCHVT